MAAVRVRDREGHARAGLRAALLEALGLKELARTGWCRRGVDRPESVAAHSWGVAWLVLALCPPELDRGRALALAVVHDLAEVRAGDITPHDGVSIEDKLARERIALAGLVAPLGDHRAQELQRLFDELEGGQSAEGRFVKACDRLDMALQAARYTAEGQLADPGEFIDSALAVIDDEALRALADPGTGTGSGSAV